MPDDGSPHADVRVTAASSRFGRISVAALVWSVVLGVDFVLWQAGVSVYTTRAFEVAPTTSAWLIAMPPWRAALWAFAVLSALVASWLLVKRRGLAVTAYGFAAVFFASGIAVDLLAFRLFDPYSGWLGALGGLNIVVSVALFWFAKRARRSGRLVRTRSARRENP